MLKKFLQWLEEVLESPVNQVRLALIVVVAIIAAIGLSQLSLQKDEGPCGPSRYVGRCFLVETEVCETTQAMLEKECTQLIRALSLPPARLTGPIIKNCIDYKYGKMFTFLRTAAPFCEARKQEIDVWGKMNKDF